MNWAKAKMTQAKSKDRKRKDHFNPTCDNSLIMQLAKTTCVPFLFLVKRWPQSAYWWPFCVSRNLWLLFDTSLQKGRVRDGPAHRGILLINCKLDKTLTYKFTFQKVIVVQMPEGVKWEGNVKSVLLCGCQVEGEVL